MVFLIEKHIHSKFISQVVTIDDVMNLSFNVTILDIKHCFNPVELGVPSEDFEPDRIIICGIPESKIIEMKKK